MQQFLNNWFRQSYNFNKTRSLFNLFFRNTIQSLKIQFAVCRMGVLFCKFAVFKKDLLMEILIFKIVASVPVYNLLNTFRK